MRTVWEKLGYVFPIAIKDDSGKETYIYKMVKGDNTTQRSIYGICIDGIWPTNLILSMRSLNSSI